LLIKGILEIVGRGNQVGNKLIIY